ncbi:MAG: hypothetical protein K1X95_05580 [Acidimicrobiia bacterium]|nr:hypothetical protein [Acidimicrobiia bacterium]
MRRGLAAALVAASLLVAACTSGPTTGPDSPPSTDAPGEQPDIGGTIVVALEREPSTLNPWATQGAVPETAAVVGPILAQLQTYDPDMQRQTQLLDGFPEVVTPDPLRVHYKLRSDAIWEDGTPVTAADVQYTLSQVLSPNNDVASRAGYNLIRDGALQDVSADQKEFTLEFTRPYGAWRDLFTSPTQPILKASAMAGQDFNIALNDFVPFSSGPFRFDSWRKGQELVVVRNDSWWGDHKSYVDRIVFRFVEAPSLQVDAMRSGEVQIASQTLQPQIARDMSSLPNVDVQVRQGPLREQLDMNQRDAVIGLPEVREAIAYAIDRSRIVSDVVAPYDSQAQVLQNAIFVTSQPGYQPHWNTYEPNADKVSDALTRAGFTRGPDGSWQKGGTKLKVTIATTQGNGERDQVAAMIKDQLAAVGIDSAVDAVPSQDLFSRLANCEYQVALYATRASPDPGVSADQFSGNQISCPGPRQNPDGKNSTGFDDTEVTQLIDVAGAEPDGAKRDNLYDQTDTILVGRIPTLPLYQKATTLAYYRQIHNVVDNATIQGPTWNAVDWWIKQG